MLWIDYFTFLQRYRYLLYKRNVQKKKPFVYKCFKKRVSRSFLVYNPIINLTRAIELNLPNLNIRVHGILVVTSYYTFSKSILLHFKWTKSSRSPFIEHKRDNCTKCFKEQKLFSSKVVNIIYCN